MCTYMICTFSVFKKKFEEQAVTPYLMRVWMVCNTDYIHEHSMYIDTYIIQAIIYTCISCIYVPISV